MSLAMEYVVIPLVLVALAIGFVVRREMRKRSPAGLMKVLSEPTTRTVGVVADAGQGRRAYLGLDLTVVVADASALLAALTPIVDDVMSGRTRDEHLLQRVVSDVWGGVAHEVLAQTAAGSASPQRLQSALETALAAVGLRLESTDVRGALEVSPELERLADYWVGDCFRGGPQGRPQKLRAIEVYLDAQRGEAHEWWVKSVPRGGGVQNNLPSTEFVAKPDAVCFASAFVGAPIGEPKWLGIHDMMAGKK